MIVYAAIKVFLSLNTHYKIVSPVLCTREREREMGRREREQEEGEERGIVGGRGTQTNSGEWQVCIAHTNKALSH